MVVVVVVVVVLLSQKLEAPNWSSRYSLSQDSQIS